ncbi:putative ubiquitin-conjugating enzyme E2 25, partial [Bienertia sinuspersici]
TIIIRVYEVRIDLLRAVIKGADGTPYHDGLFFFDFAKYHTHGLRINPNLYDDGKTCLSLLCTWRGSGVENWQPGKSTMLEVLLLIQGLIFNAEPYYNEPGYESSKASHHGRQQSKYYSENMFLL